MKYFLIFVVLFFSGCSANWHIQRAEQKEPGIFKPTVKVEYKDTIIHLDTLITLDFSDFLEMDTVPNIVYEKEYIDKVLKIYPSFDTLIKTNQGLTAKIWLKKGRLRAIFEIDSTLIYHYRDSIVILNKIITQTNTVKIEKQVPLKQYFVYGIVLLVLVLLIVIFKKK